MSNLAKPVDAGTTVREGFGETSIERRGETSASMMAAQVQAEIQARYVVAMQRPRDNDNVRIKLLRECQRPTFANKAFYSVPRKGAPAGKITGTSGRIEGLSIRFAEAAIRIAGNIWQPTRTEYDDDFKRKLNVSAIDLETNAIYSRDIIIEKTVERSKMREGVLLGTRTNSAGEKVYIFQSTEEELLQKESNLVSRTLRTESLRLIPGDTLEECEQEIIQTIRKADAEDPDGARKEIAKAFSSLNVLPSDLKAYLGHELDMCSPAQLTELRALYAAIHDGEVSWAEAMKEKLGPVESSTVKEHAPSAAKSVAAKLAERAERQRHRQASRAQPAAQPQTLSPEEQEKLRAAEANARAKRDETSPAEREPGEEG